MSRFRNGSAASSALIAIALAAIAFVAKGGTQTGRTGPTEVAILLVAGVAVAVAVLVDADSRPLRGGWALGMLALLVVITGLSMSWSITPDLSLQEMGRSLTYLAVFAVALLGARHFPLAGRQVLVGITLAALVVSVWALVTRIFPGALAESVFVARLGAPFDYWNALGGMAAMGIPGALWLASRRGVLRAPVVLAYPTLTALLITILLTQSRGALAGAVLAVIVWLVCVPLRLRSAAPLAVAVLGALPTTIYALSQDGFTKDFAELSERTDAAAPFAIFLIVSLLVVTGVGWIVAARRESLTLEPDRRRTIGRALVALMSVVVVAGVVAAAATGGGIGGRVDSLTSSSSTVSGSGAARLGSSSSSRGEYWRQAFNVFKEAPVVGRGADGFSIARLPYRKDPKGAAHAHGFLPQTGADLGLLGLAVVLALLAAWLAATRVTLGVPLSRTAPVGEWDDDRMALTALAGAVVAYGVQSFVDWTWFIPGVTATVMVAAGFLAGRGPAGTTAAARQRIGADVLRVVGASAVAVVALLCAWAVWQPHRGELATDKALAFSDQGETAKALAQAERARDIDPYSEQPLFAKAVALQGADRPIAAHEALEQAVAENPRDPETWIRLATLELNVLGLPNRAIATATAARVLDPQNARAGGIVVVAQQQLAADQAALNPMPAPKNP